MPPSDHIPQNVIQPDISVVIPSYNHARYIGQAIESVIRQTHRNWELIVIDDGSTDGTRELLDTTYLGHPHIQIFYQDNRGAHHAINRGVSMAKGRNISILNSDDVYHPDRLQTLLAYSQVYLDSLIFTQLTPVDAQGIAMAPSHPWCLFYERLIQEYRRDGTKLALLTGNFAVTTSNFFFSADLFKAIGGFRKKRYNHDWEFMARLVSHGHQIVCVGQQPLLSYRLHGNNTIMQNTLMARIELKGILHHFIPPKDPYLQRLVSRMQLNMRSIRHEHLARVISNVREDCYKNSQKLQENMRQEHEVEINRLNRSLHDMQQTLLQIQNSRAYIYAARVSGLIASMKKMFQRTRS